MSNFGFLHLCKCQVVFSSASSRVMSLGNRPHSLWGRIPKNAGNSFARDSGQDAKEDCEIGFVAPGGERSTGDSHREGGRGPVLPVPSPWGQQDRGEGLGRGGC